MVLKRQRKAVAKRQYYWHLSSNDLRAVMFWGVVVLVSLAMIIDVKEPALWALLVSILGLLNQAK